MIQNVHLVHTIFTDCSDVLFLIVKMNDTLAPIIAALAILILFLPMLLY